MNGLLPEFKYFKEHGRDHYLSLLINKDGTQWWLSDLKNPQWGRYFVGYYYSFPELE